MAGVCVVIAASAHCVHTSAAMHHEQAGACARGDLHVGTVVAAADRTVLAFVNDPVTVAPGSLHSVRESVKLNQRPMSGMLSIARRHAQALRNHEIRMQVTSEAQHGAAE